MQNAYKTVPNGYQLFNQINLEKDKKHFFRVNILSLLVILPVLPLLIFMDFKDIDFILLLSGFVGFIPIIVLHEWIHGIGFHYYSKQKVKYKFHGWAFSASTPGILYRKISYFIIGLAPAVIINVILLVLFFISEDFRLMYFMMILLHTSGCAGDFYVTVMLVKYQKNTLVEDTGIGMLIYKQVVDESADLDNTL